MKGGGYQHPNCKTGQTGKKKWGRQTVCRGDWKEERERGKGEEGERVRAI